MRHCLNCGTEMYIDKILFEDSNTLYFCSKCYNELSHDEKDAIVDLIDSCEYTSDVKCPWCGHIQVDHDIRDDTGIFECDQCEKEFEYTSEIEVMYTTQRVFKQE